MNCPFCQAEKRPGARTCRRCRRALPTLQQGDIVAKRFEILGLLGTGGMGVVFKAADRTLDEIVALKTLREGFGEVEEMVRRFRGEIRMARKVSSRNVCRIYEFGMDGDLQYISMEWVDGVTISELIQETGALPIDVALGIADQIVAGLATIHDAGIMHRDLKPSNLMRTRAGVVKLMDFGIAKALDGITLTAAGQAVGTPEYMSPEQLRGHKVDLRTDVYTTGIVIFELLTGVSPFRADTPLEAAHRQVTETPNLETPGIPSPLVPVLQRALAKDREARYRSARELRVALDLARRGLVPPSVGSPTDVSARAVPPRATQTAPPAPPAPARSSGRRVSTAESQAMMPPPVTGAIQMLRGPDPTARREAVLALAELGPGSQAAILALVTALEDPDGRVRFMAAAALGRVGPGAQAAVPALLKALDDESAGNAAAESLVKIGRAAVPVLLEVARSGQEALSSHAASTIARIGARLAEPRSN